MENSFVNQLLEVGRAAQAFIIEAIPASTEMEFWSEQREEEFPYEGTADMPDFQHWNKYGGTDAANVVKINHSAEGSFTVHGITRDNGDKVEAALHDLSSEEVVYLAEYIRSIKIAEQESGS